MKIFITGASGFVGGAVAKKLVQDHEVFALARTEKAAYKVEELGAASVLADLNTVTAQDIGNSDVVIHCAAYAEEWGSEADFYTANVEGTSHLIQEAKLAGVKRFIFIGTEAACFNGRDLIDIDETAPLEDSSPYLYSRTKAIAEKLVLQANSLEFQTISIRPRMVWGPGDQSILPALVEMVNAGKFVWIDGGKYLTSSTHIYNLVHAVSLALTSGAAGEAYFVANGERTTIKDFLSRYLATQGIQVSERSLPKWLLRPLARLVEGLWKILSIKGKPPIVRFSVDMMSAECTVRIKKAERDLGYQPVISTDEGLRTMPRIVH